MAGSETSRWIGWGVAAVFVLVGCAGGVSRSKLERPIGDVTSCVEEQLGRSPTFRHLEIGQVLVNVVEVGEPGDTAPAPEWLRCWNDFGGPIDTWNLEHLPTNEDFPRMGELFLRCVGRLEPPVGADQRRTLEGAVANLVAAGTSATHDRARSALWEVTAGTPGLATCAEEAGWYNYRFEPTH